ncbi:Fic family protein [Comamonas sp. JC664]|uniref:Fic family protein n=1 Tax=Comamonas sp. JC664 TaxID=2801917 RepID=UPI001E50B20F|nr:Fic family protein [Comamonas sp. JC664]
MPPEPRVEFEGALTSLLSKADRALGRLDGVSSILPNPDLFVAMYVRHEAVLSSQIEGTQSTLEDVLEYELTERGARRAKDAQEVVNYIAAMNHGLKRLETLPLSLRLLREIHARLMDGVRGSERSPGEFRTSQNWIGPQNCTLKTATFVPPPPHEMEAALGNLEKFLHAPGDLPSLIVCGLAHAQFETIHPFLDGNGRIGRLLIPLLLCERRILERPLLYLSVYLKAHRAEYYDRLTAIRTDGDWEGWLRFFLRGVVEVSAASTNTARSILKLREESRQKLSSNAQAVRLLDHLFEYPLISVRAAEQFLECSYVTAATVIEQLEKAGLLRETTGQKRNRLYRYDPYLALFEQHGLGTPGGDGEGRSAVR